MKFRRHVLLLAAVLMILLDSARLSAQPSGQFQDFSLVLETPNKTDRAKDESGGSPLITLQSCCFLLVSWTLRVRFFL